MDAACLNIIYDMNGVKAPNRVGEDIGFVTTFWSGLNAAAAAPGMMPYQDAINIFNGETKTYYEASKLCADNSTSKIQYTLPNVYEISSIAINRSLSSILSNNSYWSGSSVASDRIWGVSATTGFFYHFVVNDYRKDGVWCVRQ